jgi:hypothetical protein
MASDFSPILFFQRVPLSLLERFFHDRHKALTEIDFERLREDGGAVEKLFEAFRELKDKRAEIDGECQIIDQMAVHGGIAALITEATSFPHHDKTFPERMSQFETFQGRAMWTFLEHPRYWLAATSVLRAQNIADAFWRRRNDLPHAEPLVEQEDADELGAAISAYFVERQGRGHYHKVDVFRRDEREYFFVYLSDFGQSKEEWESGRFGQIARVPSFELIFTYSQAEGALDLYAPGNLAHLDDLEGIFAETILQLDEIPSFRKDKRAYVLNPLADRNFMFRGLSKRGIESIVIRRLRIALNGPGKRRVTLEVGPKQPSKAIYDLLDLVDAPAYKVTHAEFVAFLASPCPAPAAGNPDSRSVTPVGAICIIMAMKTACARY